MFFGFVVAVVVMYEKIPLGSKFSQVDSQTCTISVFFFRQSSFRENKRNSTDSVLELIMLAYMLK